MPTCSGFPTKGAAPLLRCGSKVLRRRPRSEESEMWSYLADVLLHVPDSRADSFEVVRESSLKAEHRRQCLWFDTCTSLKALVDLAENVKGRTAHTTPPDPSGSRAPLSCFACPAQEPLGKAPRCTSAALLQGDRLEHERVMRMVRFVSMMAK